MEALILAVNATCGLLLALLLGVAAARARPAFATVAAAALAAYAVGLAALAFLGVPLGPWGALAPAAFLGAAWAAAPLEGGPLVPRWHAWGAGAVLALAVGGLSAWDAWWLLPIAALLVGLGMGLWQARPAALRREAASPARDERLE